MLGGGVDEAVFLTLSFAVFAAGKVNSLYLNSIAVLTPAISLNDTPMMNAPVVVPLTEREVRAGEQVCLRIGYRFGGGFEQFAAVWA